MLRNGLCNQDNGELELIGRKISFMLMSVGNWVQTFQDEYYSRRRQYVIQTFHSGGESYKSLIKGPRAAVSLIYCRRGNSPERYQI